MAMAFLCGRNEPRALELASHWRWLTAEPTRQPDPALGPAAAPYRLS
jgi:hypothetical protein